MHSDQNIILYLTFRFFCLIIGIAFIWQGLKLFNKGVILPSGDINASWGNKALKLLNVAPGIYLFLIGGAIIIASICKGINLSSQLKEKQSTQKDFKPELYINEIDTLSGNKPPTANVDSIYNLAKNNLIEKKYLEAYKYLYWTKGLISLKDRDSFFNNEVDKNIKIATRELRGVFNQPTGETYREETKSTKISDEKIDSSQ